MMPQEPQQQQPPPPQMSQPPPNQLPQQQQQQQLPNIQQQQQQNLHQSHNSGVSGSSILVAPPNYGESSNSNNDSIFFQPLRGIKSIFYRTFGLFLDRFDLFVGLSTIALIPFLIVGFMLITVVAMVIFDSFDSDHVRHVPILIVMIFVEFFVYMLVTVIGRASVCLGVNELYLFNAALSTPRNYDMSTLRWEKLVNRALPMTIKLVQATLIVTVVLMVTALVPTVILAICLEFPNFFTIILAVAAVGIYLIAALIFTFGTSLIAPIIVLEGSQVTANGVLQPLYRSWELVSNGNWTLVSCCYLLLWFINVCFAKLIHNLFTVPREPLAIFFSAQGLVATVLPLLVFFPLHAILENVLYLNFRISRESMNYEVMYNEMQREQASYGDYAYTIPTTTNLNMQNMFASISTTAPPSQPPPSSLSSGNYRHVPLTVDEDEA